MTSARIEYDVESNSYYSESASTDTLLNSWFQKINLSSYTKKFSQNRMSFVSKFSRFETIKIQEGKALLFQAEDESNAHFMSSPGKKVTLFEFANCHDASQAFSFDHGSGKQSYIQVDFNKDSITEEEFNCIIDQVIQTRAIYKMNPEALENFPEHAKKAYQQFRHHNQYSSIVSELAKQGLIGFGAGFSETLIRQRLKQYLIDKHYTQRQILFLDLLIDDAATIILAYSIGSYLTFSLKTIQSVAVVLEEFGFETGLIQQVTSILLALKELIRGDIRSIICVASGIGGGAVANYLINKKEVHDKDLEAALDDVEQSNPSIQSSRGLRRREVEATVKASVPEVVIKKPKETTFIMTKKFFSSFFHKQKLDSPNQNSSEEFFKRCSVV